MKHVRQQIREAAKSLLIGCASCGQNVFTNRGFNYQPHELPAINIWFQTEMSDTSSLGDDPTTDRIMNLMVTGYAQAHNVQDVLDNIAIDVERILGSNQELNGLTKEIILQRTSVQFNGEGDLLAGEITLAFNVHYRTSRTNAAKALL